MRRMDRYKEELSPKEKRSEKNKDLYQNTNKYTNITDVTNANVYEINNNYNKKTSRENYQQLKKYQNIEDTPKVKKELDDFKYLYHRNEKKIYDINSVLEEARKNKKEKDDLEEKRKLKHTSYNVLSGINLEELLKYREEKKNRELTDEEKEIHDLVDTIASKTLAGELDKATTVDLLSDLMATNILDKVDGMNETEDDDTTSNIDLTSDIEENTISSELSVEDIKKREDKEDTSDNNSLKNADTEFYTRSMDLSDQDFEMDNEFADKSLPLGLKIFIFILIIAVIAVAIYFIYQKI